MNVRLIAFKPVIEKRVGAPSMPLPIPDRYATNGNRHFCHL